MASDEEKTTTGGLVSGAQTSLMEEVKLLKGMQDDSGAKRTINSELWHGCAGPLVSLPQLGSLVYYFPQGHSEQVALSTKRVAPSQIPSYPNLPSQLLCQVQNITLHADKDTDEIYAQMSLQPVNSETNVFPMPSFGLKPSKHPTEFFCKTLTASDTSTHGGFSVPRRAAEKLFPTLDYTMQPPTQELIVRDLHDNTWTFRHIYRGQPRRHLLTTGWSVFIGAKRLRAGDAVLFIRDQKSQLLVGVRRANRQLATLPSSVLSADSMHIGVLAAAAHAAANRSTFTIFYNPRACPSEFVIPLAKYRKAIYGTQISVGMRFGMMFETEESSKRRYVGTIIGISDLDPLRWPSSKWRNLQVEWDELGCGDKPKRVCSWEIETPESLFIFPSLTSGLKRPFHSGFLESEWENLIRRPYIQTFENGNVGLPFSFPYSSSDELKKTLPKPQFPNQSGILPAASMQGLTVKGEQLQELKTLQATIKQIPQLIKPENLLPQNFGQAQICNVQSDTSKLNILAGETEAKEVRGFKAPSMINPMNAKSHHDALIDQSSQLASIGERDEKKTSESHGKAENHVNPVPCLNQNMIPSEFQAGLCSGQLPLESSIPQLQASPVPICDSISPDGLVPVVNSSEWVSYLSNCQSIDGFVKSQGLSSASGIHDQSAAIPSLNSIGHETWDHQWNNTKGTSQVGQLTPLPQLDPSSFSCVSNSGSFRDLSDESNNHSGIYSSINVSNCGNSVLDPSASSTILDEFCTMKDVEIHNLSDCLLGNLSSSQDVQSQITSASLVDSQPFSRKSYPNNPGGTSSSYVDFEDASLLQKGSWQPVAPPKRTYTKVQKAGSVGRSIDVTSFNNYQELLSAIEHMFGLEGLLNDQKGSRWKLVYVDYENDVLLVGDDPWQEFVGCVRCIRILSPLEVQQMSEEGLKLLNSTAVQGTDGSTQRTQTHFLS